MPSRSPSLVAEGAWSRAAAATNRTRHRTWRARS